MRYQERIYIQNNNRGVRNKDILNVNMSSDICIFKSPKFNLSGVTKIQCDSVECDPSGISIDTIFSAITGSCYTTTPTLCFSATTWETKFYANNELVSTNNFYTTEVYDDVPSQTQLLNSITLSLQNLGYNYSRSGTTFTIYKPYGVKELELDICVSIYMNETVYTCPIGFSATPSNDACQQINFTGTTFSGTGPTIIAGNQNIAYGIYGTYFYPSIQNNPNLPVTYIGDNQQLVDASGNTITPSNIVILGNTFWSNFSGTTSGRLNNVGLSASTSEWLGFSKCIDIVSGGTYYVGIAADNNARVHINGTLIINFSGSNADNFKKWSVFPFYFNSGTNIIEMEGINTGSASAFGAEVYNPTSFATLTAATTTGQTGLVFSTREYVGQNWQLGETFGYSCPIGYALNTCSLPYTCVEIITTGITSSACSETSCLDNCIIVCDNTFPYIDNSSNGVYILDKTQTSIPFTFTFTGNTDTFLNTNASFKYEIYKYLPKSRVFKVPPVYQSGTYLYSSFSGTNEINVSIPIENLGLDGDYIIKGYFESEVCTDFLKRLGKKIDTSTYKNGELYSIYVPNSDYYFVAIEEAEVPQFNANGSDEPTYSPVSIYQQVILVDFSQEGNIDAESDVPELYERTGSTFVLTNDYVGDVLVTLNGLTLSKGIDYNLSGQVLTFIGTVSNEDIITIYYTRTLSTKLTSNTILINSIIPSGVTGGQGTNKYFYNTTSEKYEIYTTNEPLMLTRIIVILNGVTLTEGIDFYRSTTNPNRIILNGSLMVGDIITVIFYPKTIVIDGITQTNNYVGWSIDNGPTIENGEFNLQLSSDINFSSATISSIVPYQINVTNYSGILTITGDVGTKLYYRVKNIKNYESICGDPIESIAYSEIVPVVIQSNAINSY